MCEKPRLKGTKSVISTFLDVCMALLTLDFETSNKVDRTLFDRPDFNLNKKIPIVVATVLAVLAGVFLIDNSTAFKSAKKFDTEMPVRFNMSSSLKVVKSSNDSLLLFEHTQYSRTAVRRLRRDDLFKKTLSIVDNFEITFSSKDVPFCLK